MSFPAFFRFTLLTVAAAVGIALFQVSANSGEPIQISDSQKKLSASIGTGYLQARAHELVYPGPSADGELSRLIWDTEHALTIHAGLRYEFAPAVDFFADLTTALADTGHMVDYDWLGDGQDWTDRSTHPDTRLDHYYRLDLGVDWTWLQRGEWALSALAGFRYTDIAWTARGGEFVYSTDPTAGLFRDDLGSFPPGEPGISYRQKLPGVYLGPQAEWTRGRFSFRGGAVAGLTFSASDRDHHWDRDLLFVEEFDSRGFFEVSLGMTCSLGKNASLYADLRHDRYQLMKGSTWLRDSSTGTIETYPDGSAGARFESWQVRAGLQIRF
jgi:omptin